ncbi:hypothetical protein H2200_003883 [Cladophialophora chaetospira]|uniref:Tail specific protease domain-containing protein n=1 Tax=Cladophialophora chaetospira TaxID=386627 RepID=A0AA38XFP7_9EURO|nr:hypothetical protein H2200_003883 [Cladophialophora chaetospira]
MRIRASSSIAGKNMKSLIFTKALQALVLAVTALSQSTDTTATSTSTVEPCAQVAAIQSQSLVANPEATSFRLPPDVAYACQQSVPLVEEDTLDLLTGLKAWFQWQSTLAWLKDPPTDWPFAPVDLMAGLEDLSDQVQDGTLTSEIDFEWQLVDLMASARDGHFTFFPDAYSVFIYFNPMGSLVSVSSDGIQLPEVYLYQDLVDSAAQGWEPSPVDSINGTDVVSWLSAKAFNETLSLQDLDALYNALFFSINASPVGGGNVGAFFGPILPRFNGSSITVELRNGSEVSSALVAASSHDFSTVTDGESFYQSFCNITVKSMAPDDSSSSSSDTPPPTTSTAPSSVPDPNSLRPQYPSPVAISSDASLAGYFLEDEPGIAVLSVWAMTEDDPLSAQRTLTKFLDQCRENSMTHLVIDVSQNGGGTIMVAYDIFKQLFPTLEPYLGAQIRAHPQLNVLGSYITALVQETETEDPGDIAAAEHNGKFSLFDATSINNDSGLAFESWDQFFGPVEVHGDKFTQLLHPNLTDPIEDLDTGSIVVSGYGNHSEVAPQPFLSSNVIVFGDGNCGSACTIFLHLLKYQAKVESIVAGGRPRNGPAQSMGSVKGNEVEPLKNVLQVVKYFYDQAPAELIEQANETPLKDLWDNADTITLRNDKKAGPVQVNIFNAIAQYDESLTPLQFVYEAADCRLWYQPSHLLDITTLWTTVAEQAFALNGQEKYSLCVPGSTGHPSSLSGNQALFDDGQLTNVTGYEPENSREYSSDSGDSSPQQSGSASSAITGLSSVVFAMFLSLMMLWA